MKFFSVITWCVCGIKRPYTLEEIIRYSEKFGYFGLSKKFKIQNNYYFFWQKFLFVKTAKLTMIPWIFAKAKKMDNSLHKVSPNNNIDNDSLDFC